MDERPKIDLPIQKQIAYTALIVGVLTLMIEGLFSFLAPWFNPSQPVLKSLVNRRDPQKSEVKIETGVYNQISSSIHFNTLHNPLMHPDPKYMFRVMPNPKGGAVAGYHGINPQGFRDTKNYDLLLDSDLRVPVVIVGDSCGFGWKVKDYRGTFGYQLERSLSRQLGPVFNLSQPGFSSTQGVEIFTHWKKRLKPKYIVTYMGWNDVRKTPLFHDRAALEVYRSTQDSAIVRYVQQLSTYRFLDVALAKLNAIGRLPASADQELIRVPYSHAFENFKQLLEDARSRGGHLIVIHPPYVKHHLAKKMDRHFERLSAELDKERVHFLKFDGLTDEHFVPDLYHPSATGSLVLAQTVAKLISQLESSK